MVHWDGNYKFNVTHQKSIYIDGIYFFIRDANLNNVLKNYNFLVQIHFISSAPSFFPIEITGMLSRRSWWWMLQHLVQAQPNAWMKKTRNCLQRIKEKKHIFQRKFIFFLYENYVIQVGSLLYKTLLRLGFYMDLILINVKNRCDLLVSCYTFRLTGWKGG